MFQVFLTRWHWRKSTITKLQLQKKKKTVRSGETHKTQSIWVRMHFFGSLLHTNAQQLHNTIRMHILSQPEPVTNVFSHAKLQTTIASHGTVVYIFDWVANVRARASRPTTACKTRLFLFIDVVTHICSLPLTGFMSFPLKYNIAIMRSTMPVVQAPRVSIWLINMASALK